MFNENLNDIVLEKKILRETYIKGEIAETGLLETIKINCFSKNRRWSFMTVGSFSMFSQFTGQAYSDAFTTVVFIKLTGSPDFGAFLSFLSGILVFLAGLSAFMFVDKLGRKPIILGGYMTQIICMYVISYAFYFNIVWLAVIGQLVITFALYFGNIGMMYTFYSEVSDSLTTGICIAINMISKSCMS